MLKTKPELIALCASMFAGLPGLTLSRSFDTPEIIRVVLTVSNSREVDTMLSAPLRGVHTAVYGVSHFKNIPLLVRRGHLETTPNQVQHEWRTDLCYHWVDNFRELSSFDQLRNRIANMLTCGAPATVIAVNRYLETWPEKKVELFKGSPVIWRKLAEGYVPTVLYKTELRSSTRIDNSYRRTTTDEAQTLFFKHNRNLFQGSLSSAIDLGADIIERANLLGEEVLELQSYSTRATATLPFKREKTDKHKTFLGVELELEGFTPNEFKSLKHLNKHAIFKRDGSLSEGVEICTAPASLDRHVAAFKPFFDSLAGNRSQLEAKESCGLHVHIDRSKLSKLHIANLHMFLNNEANESHIVSIAGREGNSYCNPVKQTYSAFTSHPDGNRYRRLNHVPEATVELRMFASTTSFEDFCTRLEFTQAVVDYTKPGYLNLNVKQIQEWTHFASYVQTSRKSYPTLSKVLKHD